MNTMIMRCIFFFLFYAASCATNFGPEVGNIQRVGFEWRWKLTTAIPPVPGTRSFRLFSNRNCNPEANASDPVAFPARRQRTDIAVGTPTPADHGRIFLPTTGKWSAMHPNIYAYALMVCLMQAAKVCFWKHQLCARAHVQNMACVPHYLNCTCSQ